MKKKINFGVVGLVGTGLVGSVAAFLFFNSSMTNVVVSTATLKGNEKITSAMLTTKKVDKDSLPENYVKAEDIDKLVNRYTNIGITKGSVFTNANVSTEQNSKASVIPEGKTLLSIHIDNIPKGINQGDKVNILVGMNIADKGKVVMTLQSVKVTSTYVDVDGNVTGLELEVTASEAQKIQYAQLNGNLGISLLPFNYQTENLPIVDENSMKESSITFDE